LRITKSLGERAFSDSLLESVANGWLINLEKSSEVSAVLEERGILVDDVKTIITNPSPPISDHRLPSTAFFSSYV